MEPVFGSLLQHYGLCKINVLGRSGAHKVMLLDAVAFNLSKYMRSKPTRSVSMVLALDKERQQAFVGVFVALLWLHFSNKEA